MRTRRREKNWFDFCKSLPYPIYSKNSSINTWCCLQLAQRAISPSLDCAEAQRAQKYVSNPEGSTCKRPRKQRQSAARGGGGAAIFHRGGTAARHLSFWIFSILVGGFVHGMLLHPNPNFRVPRDPAEFLRACNGIYMEITRITKPPI